MKSGRVFSLMVFAALLWASWNYISGWSSLKDAAPLEVKTSASALTVHTDINESLRMSIPEVLLDSNRFVSESLSVTASIQMVSSGFRSVGTERNILLRIRFFDDASAIGPRTDPRLLRRLLPSAKPTVHRMPSGQAIGLFWAGNLGIRREETDRVRWLETYVLRVTALGPQEQVTLSGQGPLESEPNSPNRSRIPTWVDDPEWPLFLETLARESLAKAASRRLRVVGDLGKTEDGLGFVKLETAARFGGYAVKIEERGLKATLTKGSVTRVIWAGEPMVKGETGDVVMLKDGTLWVPEFWESAEQGTH